MQLTTCPRCHRLSRSVSARVALVAWVCAVLKAATRPAAGLLYLLPPPYPCANTAPWLPNAMTTTPIHISRRVDCIAFEPPKTPNDVLAAPCAVLVTETSQLFGEFVSLHPRAPRQPSNPGHNLPRLGAQFDEMKSHLAGTSLLALPRVPILAVSALSNWGRFYRRDLNPWTTSAPPPSVRESGNVIHPADAHSRSPRLSPVWRSSAQPRVDV